MRYLLFLGLCILQLDVLGQQTKYALVVGNADYEYLEILHNPVNDAKDITGLLEKVGFDVDS